MHSFLLYQFLIQKILSDEQQLTILWQCPKFIGYEKLELVYLITDFLHLWSYRVVICYCLLALTLYLVGYLAGIYQCLYTTLNCLGTLGYLTDNLHVAGSQLLAFLATEDVNHALYVLCQTALIVGSHRDDMVHAQVAHHTSLNLNLLGIGLPLHLVARLQLALAHHVGLGKHLDAFLVQITVEDYRAGCLAVQTSLLSLFLPLIRIAVAVEADRLAGLDILAYNIYNSRCLVLALCYQGIYTSLEVFESLSYGSIQYDER